MANWTIFNRVTQWIKTLTLAWSWANSNDANASMIISGFLFSSWIVALYQSHTAFLLVEVSLRLTTVTVILYYYYYLVFLLSSCGILQRCYFFSHRLVWNCLYTECTSSLFEDYTLLGFLDLRDLLDSFLASGWLPYILMFIQHISFSTRILNHWEQNQLDTPSRIKLYVRHADCKIKDESE